MDSMHEILAEIKLTEERCTLATVIKVEGSAYRKEGATMLFMEHGRQIGVISAGCLESDLAIQANDLLLDTDQSRTLVYDMRAEDDLSWGRGAGCNGKVHILLEKIDSELKGHLETVSHFLEQGTPVIAAKIRKKDTSTIRTLFVTKDQHIFGHESAASEQMIRMAQVGNKSYMQYMEEFDSDVYIHHFRPKPRLFIFGAGADVRPLASMAATTGFSVKVWDWRPTFLDHFPDTVVLRNPSIPETIENLYFSPGDSVITMTHDFQKDKELLHLLLEKEKNISYLGILGPRKRTSRLLNGGVIPERLHSPVGMSIGADGPEQIAISIIADLIQTQQQSFKEKGLSFEKKKDRRYLSSSGE